MADCEHISTTRILAVFKDAVAAHDGEVTDSFNGGKQIFARSVLPKVNVLHADDRYKRGVGLRADERGVCLRPYLFRLICQNGAIMARALEDQHLDDLYLKPLAEAEWVLREAVRACCDERFFADALHGMHRARETPAGFSLTMMHLLMRSTGLTRRAIRSGVRERFTQAGDSSKFGLINAITSFARDTPDPETRWELESYAGRIILGRMHWSHPGLTRSASVGSLRGIVPMQATTQVCPEHAVLLSD